MRIYKFDRRTYNIWRGMIKRCEDKTNAGYRYYGGRGIAICPAWKSYYQFFEDMGEAPTGLTIERMDNDKGYSPDNCKWATYLEQNNNKSNIRRLTYNHKTQTLTAWAREIGVSVQVLHHRIVIKGWPIDIALNLPLVPRNKRGTFRAIA